MKKKEIKNIGRILALLGALVCLVWGILRILGTPLAFASPFIVALPAAIANIVYGVLLIIVALIVFASYGVVDISLKFKVSWIMILIIGIVAWLFGGDLGALLLILSAIVYLIAEL